MRKLILLLSICLLVMAAPAASAQRLNLDVPGLAARAAETVDVTLDGAMLRLAGKFLSDSDADQRSVKKIVQRLEGIYVRSYEFDKEGEYDRGIIERMRAQLGPSWKKIVNVQSRTRDNVEIYVDARGENIQGLVIFAAEPKELTLVNIVGPIDLDQLAGLEGQFGIPRVSRDREKEKNRD